MPSRSKETPARREYTTTFPSPFQAFSKHWLTEGRISPDQPIRQYLRGEIDVLAATTQCFLPPGLPWWLGNVYSALGKTFGGLNMQEEVASAVREWKDYVEASPPNSSLLPPA